MQPGRRVGAQGLDGVSRRRGRAALAGGAPPPGGRWVSSRAGGRGRGSSALAGRAGAGRVTEAVPETATSRRCAHAPGGGGRGRAGAAGGDGSAQGQRRPGRPSRGSARCTTASRCGCEPPCRAPKGCCVLQKTPYS